MASTPAIAPRSGCPAGSGSASERAPISTDCDWRCAGSTRISPPSEPTRLPCRDLPHGDQPYGGSRMVPDQNFEARLIDALQPVRGAFLAQAIYQFFELGIESRLRRSPVDSSDLATELNLDRARL